MSLRPPYGGTEWRESSLGDVALSSSAVPVFMFICVSWFERGKAMFWEADFTPAMGMTPAVLLELVTHGIIAPRLELQCPMCHIEWSGAPAKAPRFCGKCGYAILDEEGPGIYTPRFFTLVDEWVKANLANASLEAMTSLGVTSGPRFEELTRLKLNGRVAELEDALHQLIDFHKCDCGHSPLDHHFGTVDCTDCSCTEYVPRKTTTALLTTALMRAEVVAGKKAQS